MDTQELPPEEMIANVRDAADRLQQAMGTYGVLLGDNHVAALILVCQEWLEKYESTSENSTRTS